MNRIATIIGVRSGAEAAWDEALALVVGVAFTFALFLGMAFFENVGPSEPPTDIADLRMVSIPIQPPPPPPKTHEPIAAPDTALPLTGLEIGSSESPVAIAVVPLDLESIVPSTANPPRAAVEFGRLHTELKPKVEMDADVRHVFQESEVDQTPRALVRALPRIPSHVRQNAATLRSVLLLVIDAKGRVESARLAKSSGNPEFDAIIARTVREEWLFSPAIRRSKKVKCLAQQAFRVNFTSGSPFEAR